jgi:hypothetical protein
MNHGGKEKYKQIQKGVEIMEKSLIYKTKSI